jgi:ubiquinone/menaquinone biosynthesis C-methylase UbiE
MKLSPTEKAQQAQFAQSYQRNQLPLLQQIERSVCGCDYGGTSWATKDEAELISQQLALEPGQRMLDLGAGAAWPGLYFATLSGCDISLVDLPLEGLAIARDRAARDRLPGHCDVAVGDARALPFSDQHFDAITHSDVLCCLFEKKAVLSECRRVLHPGGHMLFSVISISPAAKGKGYSKAVDHGPPFVETECSYERMAAESGWIINDVIDVTAPFLKTVETLITEDTKHRGELIETLGEEITAERMECYQGYTEVIANGFLRRDVYHLTAT